MRADHVPKVNKLSFLQALSQVRLFFPSFLLDSPLPHLCTLEDRRLRSTITTVPPAPPA